MAQQQRRKVRKGKRKGKIRFSSSARLVNKNDATKVSKPDTTRYPKAPTRPPADLAPTFRIKVRRKR